MNWQQGSLWPQYAKDVIRNTIPLRLTAQIAWGARWNGRKLVRREDF